MDSNKQIEMLDLSSKDGLQQELMAGTSSPQRQRESIHNHSSSHEEIDPIGRTSTTAVGRNGGADPRTEPQKAVLGRQNPTLSIKVPFETYTPNDVECPKKEQVLIDDSDSQSSICVSPTWPVSAEKELKHKRRLEKQRRGAQKRLDKVERRIQKVEERTKLDEDKRDRSSMESSTLAAKSKRPSFSLPRLSFSLGVPQIQNEKEKSRRLSKSNPADYLHSSSTDQRTSIPERRPSIKLRRPSRRGAPWTQSLPSFQFPTLARLNGSRGQEVVDNQPSSSRTGSGPHPKEVIKASQGDTPPSEHNPKEGGPATQAGTFASIECPANSKLPLLAVSSKNPQRKLARKGALPAQSPRQLYSQDSSFRQTKHGDSSINAQFCAPQAATLHVHNLLISTSVNSDPSPRYQPNASSHLREGDPNGVKSERLDQGAEPKLQRQQHGKLDAGLKDLQGPIEHVQRPVDHRAAQILAWNEQVAAQGPSALANQESASPSATIYHRRKACHNPEEVGDRTKPVDTGNQGSTPASNPGQNKQNFRSSEQNPSNPSNYSSLVTDTTDKFKSAAWTSENMFNLTTLETNIPDEAASQITQPPPQTVPWSWTSPFRSLWRTSGVASFNTSGSSRHSTYSETPVENTDIVLVSSTRVPQSQRSRCSSTTIKPPIDYEPQIRTEPETSIMKATQRQLSNISHRGHERSKLQPAEVTAANSQLLVTEATIDELEQDRWSQIVNWEQASSENNATSIEWKFNERCPPEHPDKPPGAQKKLSQNVIQGEIASCNLSTSIECEVSRRIPQETPETPRATRTITQKNATATPGSSAAVTPSISYPDLTKPTFPPTIRDYQEKFSVSDGSESISHLSTKSTSLSSSFDKCSLPLGTSANSYGNYLAPTNKRGIRGSAANKPIQPRLAKIFVVCCHCCRWHDPPSHYFMEWSAAKPNSTNDAARRSEHHKKGANESPANVDNPEKGATKFACHWCNHEMTRQCCAAWTSVCSLTQKH